MSTVARRTIAPVIPSSVRGQQRVSRILEAATRLFLRDGYQSTPIDAIVERSGGSKATLYNYFPTKEALFRAVVDNIVDASVGTMEVDIDADVGATLRKFAEARLGIVFSRRHQDLLRLVIAERDRFPDLAEMYFERGPMVSQRWLVSYLAALRDNGKLVIDDVERAAHYFVGMLLHDWYKKQLLLLNADLPAPAEVADRVEQVVTDFLQTYR